MIRRLTLGGSIAAAAAALAAGALTTAPGTTSVVLAGAHTPMSGRGNSALAAPAPKKCAANFVSGTIGGQPKCLAAGQQCQQANSADYGKYGFSCVKAAGNRYQLSKKGAAAAKPAGKPHPKPAPKPSPKPSPKPAPPSHR